MIRLLSNGDEFKKNTFLLTIGTIIYRGLQYATIPFFSEWLTTEEYGRFDLLVTYVSLLLPIITLANQEGVFRLCVNEVDGKRKQGFITCGFIIDVSNYILFEIVLFEIYGRSKLHMFIVFSLYLLGEIMLVYFRGVLRALKKINIYSFALVFSTVLMIFFVTILVYYYNLGLIGIIFGYAIGSICGSIIIAILIGWLKYINIYCVNKQIIFNIIAYSAPLIPNDLSWWAINASDRQIINYFFGDASNGIYAIAHKVPAICSVLFSTVSISWQQKISISIENNEKIDINRYLNVMIRIICSFCILVLSGSFVLFYCIFDEKYYEASLYSPILIVSAAVLAISLFMGGILVGYKRTSSNGYSTVAGAITNIILHIALIYYIGLYAAAISTLISNVITLLIRIFALRDIYKVKISNENYIIIIIMFYFTISAMYNRFLLLNALNLCSAIMCCCVINKELLKDILSKNRY